MFQGRVLVWLCVGAGEGASETSLIVALLHKLATMLEQSYAITLVVHLNLPITCYLLCAFARAIFSNRLTGTIPDSFGEAERLYQLYVRLSPLI